MVMGKKKKEEAKSKKQDDGANITARQFVAIKEYLSKFDDAKRTVLLRELTPRQFSQYQEYLHCGAENTDKKTEEREESFWKLEYAERAESFWKLDDAERAVQTESSRHSSTTNT